MLAAEGPERTVHLAQEAVALVFVDMHYFIEQAKIIAVLPRHGAERHYVFGEAGTSIADSGVEEARADAGFGADAVHDLIHVSSHRFADGGYGVNERNLQGKKGIASVLDEFRAL